MRGFSIGGGGGGPSGLGSGTAPDQASPTPKVPLQGTDCWQSVGACLFSPACHVSCLLSKHMEPEQRSRVFSAGPVRTTGRALPHERVPPHTGSCWCARHRVLRRRLLRRGARSPPRASAA